jgi:hypothetical protein
MFNFAHCDDFFCEFAVREAVDQTRLGAASGGTCRTTGGLPPLLRVGDTALSLSGTSSWAEEF